MPYYATSGQYHRDGCPLVELELETAAYVDSVPAFGTYADCPYCEGE